MTFRYKSIRKMNIVFAVLLLFVTVSTTQAPIAAQAQNTAKQAFTSEDVLNLRSFSVGSISDDGRFIAGTVAMRRDRLNVDHLRFGDPTYVSRSVAELVVIDTETKEMKSLFDEKVQTRSLRWSPDGTLLAFLLRKGDDYILNIYDSEKGKVNEIKLKTDKKIATNSSLQWRPDGSGILLSLRDSGWSERSRNEFLALSAGPIIVRDSKKPFLAWDEVRSNTALQISSVVELNGNVKELLPETRVSGIRQSEDGQFIVYTKTNPLKTSYTRTGGTEYELFMLDLQDGELRSIRKKKVLAGLIRIGIAKMTPMRMLKKEMCF